MDKVNTWLWAYSAPRILLGIKFTVSKTKFLFSQWDQSLMDERFQWTCNPDIIWELYRAEKWDDGHIGWKAHPALGKGWSEKPSQKTWYTTRTSGEKSWSIQSRVRRECILGIRYMKRPKSKIILHISISKDCTKLKKISSSLNECLQLISLPGKIGMHCVIN